MSDQVKCNVCDEYRQATATKTCQSCDQNICLECAKTRYPDKKQPPEGSAQNRIDNWFLPAHPEDDDRDLCGACVVKCDSCEQYYGNFDGETVWFCVHCQQNICVDCARERYPANLDGPSSLVDHLVFEWFFPPHEEPDTCGACLSTEEIADKVDAQESERQEYFKAREESQREAENARANYTPDRNNPEDPVVSVQRQYDEFEDNIAETNLSELSGFHWTDLSGGVGTVAPQELLHAYVMCTRVTNHISHSCEHGMAPHSIKVCVCKNVNENIWSQIISYAENNRANR